MSAAPIAVCLKWVDRTTGLSAPDAAALEWALRDGERGGRPVMALAAGPPGADAVLREGLACGAARAVRVDLAAGAPSSVVAEALAAVIVGAGASRAWCGDHSVDRGSGSVPAYLAAELGAAQALGLVEVTLGGNGTTTVLRRLDGGRRERLLVGAGGVFSVEGSTARLRRASLGATMTAGTAVIEVAGDRAGPPPPDPVLRPFRPRSRVLPGPVGSSPLERIAALTDSAAEASHATVVALEPAEAAERILAALVAWGYLP